jgi:hypothetical protein
VELLSVLAPLALLWLFGPAEPDRSRTAAGLRPAATTEHPNVRGLGNRVGGRDEI